MSVNLTKKAEAAILAVILLLGAALRLLYLGEISSRPDFTHPGIDAAYHIHWAEGIVTGDWSPWPGRDDPQIYRYPYYRPPGYAFFLAAVYRVFGSGPLRSRLVQMAMGLASAALAFYLGRRWSGVFTGLLFAFLQAVYWIFIFYEGELLDPSLSVVLTLAFVGLTASAAFGLSFLKVAAAGLVLGFLVLVRPNALVLYPLAGGWLVWELRRRGEKKRSWPVAALLAAAAAAVILPVTVRNYLVGGELVPIATNQGISLLVANNPDSDGTTHSIPEIGEIGTPFDWPRIVRQLSERLGRPLTTAEASDYLSRQAWRFVRDHPGRFLWLTGRKALLFWGPYEIRNVKEVHYARLNSRVLGLIPLNFSLVLALGLAGAVCWWRDIRRGRAGEGWASVGTLAALTGLGYFVSMLPFAAAARYRVPVIPFLLWFASWGIVRWAGLLRSGRWKLAAVAFLSAAAVWFVVSRNWAGYRPSPEKWHYDLGLSYLDSGEWEKAVESFEEAIRYRPDYGDAFTNMGIAWHRGGRLDLAERAFRQALRLKPDSLAAHKNLADLLFQAGRSEEGFDHYRRALEIQSVSIPILIDMGNAFRRQGEPERAREKFLRALEVDPASVRAGLGLASVYQDTGDLERAEHYYRRILEFNPGHPLTRYNLALLLQGQGRFEEAAEHYRRAIETRPEYLDAYNNLGVVLVQLGRGEEAVEVLRSAIRMEPRDMAANFNLALTYFELGENERGVRQLERTLEIDPGFEPARRILETRGR